MIGLSDTQAAVRYIDNMQLQRDLEVRRQAELASKKGPSFFLSYGLDRARPEVSARVNVTRRIVSNARVAQLSAEKLAAEASRAAVVIETELTPHGLKVFRGDGAVTRPFASKHLVHLCETTVCSIPYVAKGKRGRLVVIMTNFASGVAVPTKGGICYKDVVPMHDTTEERNAFRVLGVTTDSDGQTVDIDHRFTAKGIAWSVKSIQAITDACKQRFTQAESKTK